MKHQVVLVPGFFGFGSLGELTYFVGVRETLTQAFSELGLDANVVEVPTLPTASIRHRAARVLETIAAVAQLGPGPIHLVGHSTGGLDARLAIAPTASLPTQVDFREYDRIHSLVTVSAPHFGTPVASFFGSAMGYPLLKVVAAFVMLGLRQGRVPLGVALKLGHVLTRLDDWVGLRGTIVDQLYDRLLADFSEQRRAEVVSFIEGISNDQSLIFQLTPAGVDLLNASTADPEGVRYGSVVTRARPPRVGNVLANLTNPYAQGMHALYAALHRICAHGSPRQFPDPVPEQRARIEADLGLTPTYRDSDGIVPTLSQVWGEVIHAARADHLDVVGHFGTTEPGQLETDWLPSHSGFDERSFRALWRDVAAFITRDATEPARECQHVGTERTELPVDEVTPSSD